MSWCEHCRDHFDRDHYDKDGYHMHGNEYGPVGAERAELERLRARVKELEALLVVQAHGSQ